MTKPIQIKNLTIEQESRKSAFSYWNHQRKNARKQRMPKKQLQIWWNGVQISLKN